MTAATAPGSRSHRLGGMRRARKARHKMARLLTLFLLAAVACRLPAAADETAAERAARVAHLLEAGRISEGLGAARRGVADYPGSSLLRRRLAQAELCEALRVDSTLDPIADD